MARPRGVFFIAELALLTVVLLQALRAGWSFEAPLLIALCGFFFHLKTLDRSIVGTGFMLFLRDLFQALSAAIGTAALLFFLFPALTRGAAPALAGAFLAALIPLTLRPIVLALVSRKRLVERILIVGTGDLAEKLFHALDHRSSPAPQERSKTLLRFPERLADAELAVDPGRLQEIVARERISRVVVAEQDEHSRTKLAAALVDARLRGLRVSDAQDFYEQTFGRIWVDALNSEWFVYTDGFYQSKAGRFMKRAFDLAFSVLLLVLAAPLFVIIAIATKLDSTGPVLFRQVRVGRHGKTFVIYKFRSMREDAEVKIGPAWATERDNRVTRVGGILRKFRLDELPQAINVLRGEMSVVGPRPERPYFVDRLSEEIPFYNLRHYVRPGITGWAQVRYPYGASIDDAREKLQYDIHYVKHRSMVCDLKILCQTVKIVLIGRGR